MKFQILGSCGQKVPIWKGGRCGVDHKCRNGSISLKVQIFCEGSILMKCSIFCGSLRGSIQCVFRQVKGMVEISDFMKVLKMVGWARVWFICV